jgi:hypothetical protein
MSSVVCPGGAPRGRRDGGAGQPARQPASRETRHPAAPYFIAVLVPIELLVVTVVVLHAAPRPWDEVGTYFNRIVMADLGVTVAALAVPGCRITV